MADPFYSHRWRATRRYRALACLLIVAAAPVGLLAEVLWQSATDEPLFSPLTVEISVVLGAALLMVLMLPEALGAYFRVLRRARWAISIDPAAHTQRQLMEKLGELDNAIAERSREAERLERIIENYRAEASSEFRQAATDLLGEESAATVAGYFTEWARSLGDKHASARRIAIALVVIGGTAVSLLLLRGVERGFDAQLVVAKLSVGIPFGVLYTVFYREAVHYRRDELMAESVAVQMRSVAAYTIWLDKDSKDAVRRKLGEAIFVGPPAHLVHDGKHLPPDAVSQDLLLQLVRSLLANPQQRVTPTP